MIASGVPPTVTSTATDIESEAPSVTDLEIQDIEGIGPTTAKKLKEAGIVSPMDLAVATADEMATEINITKESAAAFIMSAQKLLRDYKVIEKEFVTADVALENEKISPRICSLLKPSFLPRSLIFWSSLPALSHWKQVLNSSSKAVISLLSEFSFVMVLAIRKPLRVQLPPVYATPQSNGSYHYLCCMRNCHCVLENSFH